MVSGGGNKKFVLPFKLGFIAITPVRGDRNEYRKKDKKSGVYLV